MKRKYLLIITLCIVFIITALVFIFYLLPALDPIKRETRKVSNNLFEIDGGVYYGDGYLISQAVTEDGQTTVFNLVINSLPFKETSVKALAWLQSQNVMLDQINYVCGPSRFIQASNEEIAACTHLINK